MKKKKQTKRFKPLKAKITFSYKGANYKKTFHVKGKDMKEIMEKRMMRRKFKNLYKSAWIMFKQLNKED